MVFDLRKGHKSDGEGHNAHHNNGDPVQDLGLRLHTARCKIVFDIGAIARGDKVKDHSAAHNCEPAHGCDERQTDDSLNGSHHARRKAHLGQNNKQAEKRKQPRKGSFTMTKDGLGKQTGITARPGIEQAKSEMVHEKSNKYSSEKQTDGS